MNTTTLGQQSEAQAQAFLLRQGLRCVARNYHAPYGEIDLIMTEGEVLVFVEIRYRSHTRFGLPCETVTSAKQTRVIQTAAHFLQHHRQYESHDCRFDVIGMSRHGKINWIKDAFQVQ